MTEILAPAGNEESATTAINCGADAVYVGLTAFSARANADNFDEESLSRVVRRAHLFGVKIYVAMNIAVKEDETEEFLSAVVNVHNLGADAVIVQDIFLGKYIHERYPAITLHLSTQAGTNNLYGARLAKEYGFSRVILARETPFEDIQTIARFMETEVFVQGALCSCFSGQCYLSGFAGGNSGNRGRCKQPCRKKYSYNRAGYEEKAYALSLSDLSVGENILKYVDAGVFSFKIEGRMRRPEYVAAAIHYYRKILNGGETRKELSDLKRTFNRNNYTRGLAFGQDKRLLSREIQGHMGEKVGVVSMRDKRAYCESNFLSVKGDCFKIIRKGKEVGGAVFEEKDGRGFYLSSRARLMNGDGVFVTTDTALNERLLKGKKRIPIAISLFFKEGERPEISSSALNFSGEDRLEKAKSRPLTAEELKECFQKSEFFEASIEKIRIEGDIFIPKSKLNELRRRFYAAVEERLSGGKKETYEVLPYSSLSFRERNDKTAVITDEPVEADVVVFKPRDYSDSREYEKIRSVKGEKFLFLPPFVSSSDMEIIKDKVALFDGVYAECFWGVAFAEEARKPLFAGLGFNATNAVDVEALRKIAKYYCLSKELDFSEQKKLCASNAFVLTAGSVKVMDLIYCPFEKTCEKCDKKSFYELTDENDRAFKVRRYRLSSCRFELYNCADLVACQNFAGRLVDLSAVTRKKEVLENVDAQEQLKKIFNRYTFGHSDKTVL